VAGGCERCRVGAGVRARTPRGRVATEAAFRHLGHPVPRGGLLLSGGTGDPPADGASSQTLFDA
jgi:Holliday junction DNA helicase RuvB